MYFILISIKFKNVLRQHKLGVGVLKNVVKVKTLASASVDMMTFSRNAKEWRAWPKRSKNPKKRYKKNVQGLPKHQPLFSLSGC